MHLFKKFSDTKFLKNDSELENKVNQLRKLKEKYPNNKEIISELKISEAGLEGEKDIEYILKNANIGMYVLHDINIVAGDLKAQIDYIVITPAKCYFIECKNMVGEITIDSTGQFIREYNGTRIAIESPLRQSERHREVLLKKYNSEPRVFLDLFFNEEAFENYHVPIVVFSNKSTIINMENAPGEIKERVIRSENLIDYIKKDVKNTKSVYLDNKKEMKRYAEYFLKNNIKQIIDYEKQFNLNSICPECGGKLVLRDGQYGPFMGCSNYPKCTYIKKIKED